MEILILSGGITPEGNAENVKFFFFSHNLPLPKDNINTTFSLK